MKKVICLLMAFCMAVSLTACGGSGSGTGGDKDREAQAQSSGAEQEAEPQPEPAQEAQAQSDASEPDGSGQEIQTGSTDEPAQETAAGEWTRAGYFQDEDGNMLSVTLMDDLGEDSGWYVGFMNGEDFIEDSYGGMLEQEGNTLRGTLPTAGSSREDINVVVSEEGEDGLMLAVEGGETFHFAPTEMEEAEFGIYINTEGLGQIDYAKTEEELDFEDGYYTSAGFGLFEPETYVFGAKTDEEGWGFIKWTKNGGDYSTDPIITVELTEDAEFVAVFEYVGGDGQNPVMNFIGEYVCDRAHALVEAVGDDGAQITIDWGGSAWELARWEITGPLDPDTLTVAYSGCRKSVLTYDDNGDLKNEEVEYEDGTGTVVFNEDGTFTWKDDQSGYSDLVFEWSWTMEPEEDAGADSTGEAAAADAGTDSTGEAAAADTGADSTGESAAEDPNGEKADYSLEENWAYFGIGEDKPADLFLICPTVDTRDEFNMSMDDEEVKQSFFGALNMERGIYEDSTRMYAPYYRQAAMKIYSMESAEWEPYLSLAYSDVSAAFSWYLENENDGRPIILAGFSQGADMCYRLLEEYFGDEELYSRLVAVYAIGWPCTQEMADAYPQIRPAQGEGDVGVVVNFNSEAPEVEETFINPKDQKALAINPLNWKTDTTPADRSENIGACFTSYAAEIKREEDAFCGCYLDENRGVLKVTDVDPSDFPPIVPGLPEGAYHVYDYQFFFRNLQQNVGVRVNAFQEKMNETEEDAVQPAA